MCQLIEVTWSTWKLSADQLIVFLDRDQCSIPYFPASLGAQGNWYTYWTSMLWLIDSCQNNISADQYHLPYRGFRCRPIEVKYFFEVIRWQDTGFQMIAGSSLIFFNSFEICCVYVSHNENFYFKLTSDAKIQPAATGREDSCFWLFSPCSRVGHASRPIFMLWLVKIWQVSSCGKFIQHLESCLLLCQLVMYLTVFFHWMYKMKFSCYQESSVIHG